MSTSTREDFRRRKELEEARKAGTIPAEVDEEGNEINPHIPKYIAQAPWYIDSGQPSLRHQKVGREDEYHRSSPYVGDEEKFGEWYQRGLKQQQSLSATRYRKGACENCGSMTHKVKDCLERPRKLGARWTGKDIAGDELIQEFEFSFDAKRDRWNGYDGEDHMRLIEEWELIEEARKKLKQQEADQNFLSKNVDTSSSNNGGELLVKTTIEEGDEDKYAEASDMPGQKVDLKTRTTVRNLRIREDTAKYLRNLDPRSAYYDPKTRSMRENPNKDKDPSELAYAGDNFVRASGDVSNFARVQMFAWEATEKGDALHTLATPSQTELMYKQNLENKGKTRELEKRMILERYGGEEHLEAPSQDLLLAQSEHYVEYSRTGKLIKGEEKQAHIRSRYEEDSYINNHTSVWGSFWQDGRWGYACCHQFLKSSYCLGKKVLIESVEDEYQVPETQDSRSNVSENEELSSSSSSIKNNSNNAMAILHEHDPKNVKKSRKEDKKTSNTGSRGEISTSSHKKLSDSSDVKINETQWQSMDERKRPYTSSLLDSQPNDELNEEQLEIYRLKRPHAADPMKDYISKDR